MRRIKLFISLFVLFLILQKSPIVFAGAFQVTKIGKLDTNGALFDTWHYTDSRPSFAGIGLAGETVAIVLDGEPFSTTVDESNNWSWTPSEALSGDNHYISFASAGSSVGFNLTVGSEIPEGISAPAPAEAPIAGALLPTILISSFGTTLLGASYFLRKKK